MVVLPSVAAWAALDHQQAPIVGAALVALRVAALRGFGPSQARPQQAPLDGAALVLASVAASLAAQDPQPTPDGAALVALVEGRHQQAPCWATLV